MAAEFEDLTLRMLREIREDMRGVKDEVGSLNRRMTAVERGIGELKVDMAETHHRLDKFGGRIERIERRLDLTDSAFMEAAEKFEDS
ncbi:hypothetical protein [Hellea balneolensis]|uniref:hypothetical protein n=1 Tax=Hellea balneolensis TaxID=287478 RepID=UPI000427608D|nr:hypothetical protein [Hellea balneolensis]